MIKRDLKDFGNDYKTYNSYMNAHDKTVKEYNKINRAKWNSYLRTVILNEYSKYLYRAEKASETQKKLTLNKK